MSDSEIERLRSEVAALREELRQSLPAVAGLTRDGLVVIELSFVERLERELAQASENIGKLLGSYNMARELLARCVEDGVGIHQTIVKVRAFLDPRRDEARGAPDDDDAGV